MSSRVFCFQHSQVVFVLLLIAALPGLMAGQECINHISVEGVTQENIIIKGNKIIINYPVQQPQHQDTTHRLYAVQWDENIKPKLVSKDLPFSKLFKIDEKNNTWIIYAKTSLWRRLSRELQEDVEARSTIGPFGDSLNCMIILKHHFNSFKETTDLSNGIRTFEKGHFHGDFVRSSHQIPKKAKADLGSTASSIHEVSLLQEETGYYSTFSTTTDDWGNGDEEFNFRVTVGIIGGFLGLVFIVAIGFGIYYNQRKGMRLGLIRRRHKENKNISILGAAYPNVAMSNTDVRLNEADDCTTGGPYPNYAYANPSATEPVPNLYDSSLYDSIKIERCI